MAKGVNKVILIGHLGADPEVRSTQGGTIVANLRLATNERRKQGDQWVDETEWHRVVTFGRLAEVCRDYLTKGRQIYIEGSIRTNKWKDRDGNDKYTTEIIANEMQMLGGRDDGGSGGGRSGGAQTPSSSGNGGGGAPPTYNEPSIDDDDIPF